MPVGPSSSGFDAGAYKRSTRQQWQEAAEAWHRWGPTLERWLGAATTAMLDIAGVGEGDRVLDVAAGAGGQTLAAARRVGPQGSVLATDIAPQILQYAELEARRAGVANVTTRVVDGEQLAVEPATYDAVISRLGLMYFPDKHAALRGMHRALRPAGRLSAIVFSTADRNAFFSIPIAIVRRRAGLGSPAPGQPGPFSLGDDGAIADALRKAGFGDIEVRTVPAPLRLASAVEYVRFARESFGALHEMLAGLQATERQEAWAEIEQELGRFDNATGFEGPCELLVAAGTR
jgi:ubiquinone/menaquinone biosynthesis C-methylase UbiE